MVLLGDATGQTPRVSTIVQAPWAYAYEYPIDCMKLRYVPWNSNPVQPNPPLSTGLQQFPGLSAVRLRPAPFLESNDSNYPPEVGGAPNPPSGIPAWATTEGTGPTSRTVILTNVPPQPQGSNPACFPSAVYTAFIQYPSQWDALFEDAFVNYLAEYLSMPLIKDKRLARELRNDAIAIVKAALSTARAQSANESGYPQTVSRQAEWVRARDRGAGNNWGGSGFWDTGSWDGPGILWGGWDGCSFSDGSVY